MRKPLIAGNWKMFKTPAESLEFFQAFLPLVAGHTRDEIAIFPSITSLSKSLEATTGSNVAVGAQTMHWLNEGAYTGETSPTMLTALGCHNVLLGHSEQRHYFGESNERINLKLKAAINHAIRPIVCVGESLYEREEGHTETILHTQIRAALHNVTPAEAHNLVIAYEPVWAIGTGKTASPAMAQAAHEFIRKTLATTLDEHTAAQTRILYGGSVKPENVSELMQQPDIDGALVGGASLVPTSFASLVHYV